MELQKLSNIKVDEITFQEPFVNNTGAQTILMKYNKNKLIFQIPESSIPNGITTNNNKHFLDLKVEDKTTIECLNEIDNYVKTQAEKMSNEWFKKVLAKETIDEIYKPTIKFSDSWRINFPMRNNEFVGEIYDSMNNIINTDVLNKKSRVDLIVQLTGIYFISNSFGISWKVLQVRKNKNATNECMFKDNEDEDIET